MKAFPKTVKDKSAISADLMSHLRYPEDLFRVQRDILASYHVKDAASFYGGQDFWRVPSDPSTFGGNAGVQPPYYLTLKLPKQSEPAFSLTTPLQSLVHHRLHQTLRPSQMLLMHSRSCAKVALM
jgi:uncharacterized membrane protein (UPF0182 family)